MPAPAKDDLDDDIAALYRDFVAFRREADENEARAAILGTASRTQGQTRKAGGERAGGERAAGERKRPRVAGSGDGPRVLNGGGKPGQPRMLKPPSAKLHDSLQPGDVRAHALGGSGSGSGVDDDDNSPDPAGRKLFESPEAVHFDAALAAEPR